MALKDIFKSKSTEAKYFVVSIPKAGTYYLSEILKSLGIVQTFLHIDVDKYEDYSKAPDLLDMRKFYYKFSKKNPLKKTLKLLKDNQFAVGHIPYEYNYLFSEFKKIFIKRNVKDVIVSYMNFIEFSGRGAESDKLWMFESNLPLKLQIYLEHRGPNLLESIKKIMPWDNHNETLTVKYEDLSDLVAGVEIIKKIILHTEKHDFIGNEKMIIENCLNAKTLTKSPKIYDKQQYWNKYNEMLFRQMGGEKINTFLGYM